VSPLRRGGLVSGSLGGLWNLRARSGQGRGLGGDLLQDAVLRVLAAGERIGVRAILVHAISDEAKAFYERHGFRASPIEPMTLMITLAEARRMLAGDN
jgi:GNAT superfamily N-acetyltransferase